MSLKSKIDRGWYRFHLVKFQGLMRVVGLILSEINHGSHMLCMLYVLVVIPIVQLQKFRWLGDLQSQPIVGENLFMTTQNG